MSKAMQFHDFALPPAVQQALKDLSFATPTEIQARSLPVVLDEKDVMACAQTGSGKSAAYCLPMITTWLKHPNTNALVLVRTRELATQIADVLHKLTRHTPGLHTAVLIGGMDMRRQIQVLKRKPRVCVGTPGRVLDHLRQKSLSLAATHFLVLDEGDRMLDMGFAPQLDQILKFVPKQRQTLLFSATLPPKIRKLAEKYLNQPQHITVGEVSQPVELITQTAVQTTHKMKNDVLMDELNARTGSVIIFARTQRRTDRLAEFLEDFGYKGSRIHGGRTQGQRNQALSGFRDGRYRILVATDVASRGIDVPEVAHVVNYDLPMFDEDYVHRIGRTARAGAKGEALSLLTPEDQRQWSKLSRKFNIAGGAGRSE
ncbi:MAG: DEAD/DEAH box helicase, partial [Bdellovibrionales bacterium]